MATKGNRQATEPKAKNRQATEPKAKNRQATEPKAKKGKGKALAPRRAGGALPDAVQRSIVIGLACYATPTEIAGEIEREFGAVCSLSQLAHYNPRNASSRLRPELRELFDSTRARYRAEVEDVAIMQRAWRQAARERAARGLLVVASVDPKAAAALNTLLDSAAREEGGTFTNRALLDVKETALHYVIEVPAVMDREAWLRQFAPQVKP